AIGADDNCVRVDAAPHRVGRLVVGRALPRARGAVPRDGQPAIRTAAADVAVSGLRGVAAPPRQQLDGRARDDLLATAIATADRTTRMAGRSATPRRFDAKRPTCRCRVTG